MSSLLALASNSNKTGKENRNDDEVQVIDKKGFCTPQTMRKNENRGKLVYRTKKTRKTQCRKNELHLQLYGNLVMKKEMKKTVVKEFCDWSIEEMVEYVLTGRKPMKMR